MNQEALRERFADEVIGTDFQGEPDCRDLTFGKGKTDALLDPRQGFVRSIQGQDFAQRPAANGCGPRVRRVSEFSSGSEASPPWLLSTLYA